MLQGLAEHAVEGDVWTQDVALLPAVFLQLLDLGPQAIQVLRDRREEREDGALKSQFLLNPLFSNVF